jgi:hypothetical protein
MTNSFSDEWSPIVMSTDRRLSTPERPVAFPHSVTYTLPLLVFLAAALSSVSPTLLQHLPSYKQRDGADERQEEACRVELRANLRLAEDASCEAAGDRARDSEPGGHPEAHDVGSRHERAGNQSDDETDCDRPQNVQHEGLPSLNGMALKNLSLSERPIAHTTRPTLMFS